MAKITFEDGTVVNFDGTPTPKDVEEVANQLKIKNKTFNVIVNLVSGFISRKVIVGKSGSTFKALLSQLTQYLTTQFVVKNVKS